MEFEELETEAKRKAAKHVANMLHTPDKLEKVHQMKWNVTRKKASVEAMLKTAMQSQLDGVKTGLGQLQDALSEMKDIKGSMDEIESNLKDLPGLSNKLVDVREETLRHSQLATARENLKHIFMVPETVRNTEIAITEGRLLEAHKAMAELEQSRDDLLFELHKLQQKQYSTVDRDLLAEYFKPVTELSDKLEKQIKFILRRTLNTVRKEPKVIVTALRVIEREEKADAECLGRQKSTGFLPPNRPKMWRKKAMEVLKVNVMERVEGNQLDERDQNKMWLVRHLELIRLVTLEDLRVAKTLCQPAFPPHYNILDHFMDLYHEALSNRLREIISLGLEGQEYVSILSWIIQTYPGGELMCSDTLNIPRDKIKPLLDNQTIEELQKQYLQNMQDNYVEWMKNALSLEASDWKSERNPELDNENCFHTSAPKIIFQMIEENLQVAATISPELTNKVFVLSMGEVANFGLMYRDAIVEFKSRYFRDRTTISLFTQYMIALVNNCELFEELGQDLKERWWKSGHHDNEATAKFEALLTTYSSLRTEAANYLLDEAFLDIEVHFADLMSSRWATTTESIDTVVVTLDDYFQDYLYLRSRNFELIISLAQDRVAKRYITSLLQPQLSAMLRKKINIEKQEDRAMAAKKIAKEAKQLQMFFHKVAGDMADFDSPFKAIEALAEVLGTDEEMLALDVGNLVKKYPDVTYDQLCCLLILRGDQSKSEAREKALEYIPNSVRSNLQAKSIFSQVLVSASINPFASGKEAAASLNPFASGKEAAASLNPFTKD